MLGSRAVASPSISRVFALIALIMCLCGAGVGLVSRHAAAERGQWTPLEPFGGEAVHLVVMPGGSGGYHSRVVRWMAGSGDVYGWQPPTSEGCGSYPTGSFTSLGWAAGAEIFCGGQTQLANGDLLTAGGNDNAADYFWGIVDARSYSPASGSWTQRSGNEAAALVSDHDDPS